jgi:hypothetical protein
MKKNELSLDEMNKVAGGTIKPTLPIPPAKGSPVPTPFPAGPFDPYPLPYPIRH